MRQEGEQHRMWERVMLLLACLAACVAAMCAFCRRSPLLAGKRRCILTYMWPSYHEVFAAGPYRLMAYREQYIPQRAGEYMRAPCWLQTSLPSCRCVPAGRSLPVLLLPGNGGCHKQASLISPQPGSIDGGLKRQTSCRSAPWRLRLLANSPGSLAVLCSWHGTPLTSVRSSQPSMRTCWYGDIGEHSSAP